MQRKSIMIHFYAYGSVVAVMEERRGELKQLEDMEEKTVKEVASIKDKKTSLQSDFDKFNQLEDLRTESETKCAVLSLFYLVSSSSSS